MRHALLLGLLLGIPAYAAQPIVTVPPHPVAGVPFIIRVTVTTCPLNASAPVLNGTNLDITITFAFACVTTSPPVTLDVPAGPLPAGTYTVRVFSQVTGSSPFVTQPVVVGTDVPALDPWVLAMLAIALIVIAALRLRA